MTTLASKTFYLGAAAQDDPNVLKLAQALGMPKGFETPEEEAAGFASALQLIMPVYDSVEALAKGSRSGMKAYVHKVTIEITDEVVAGEGAPVGEGTNLADQMLKALFGTSDDELRI